jgi:hypothetical protein
MVPVSAAAKSEGSAADTSPPPPSWALSSAAASRCFRRREQEFKFLRPIYKIIRRYLPLLICPSPLKTVEYLIAYIDSRTGLVIAYKGNCVRKSTNDAAVARVKLGLNDEVGGIRHVPVTGRSVHGSLGQARRGISSCVDAYV